MERLEEGLFVQLCNVCNLNSESWSSVGYKIIN